MIVGTWFKKVVQLSSANLIPVNVYKLQLNIEVFLHTDTLAVEDHSLFFIKTFLCLKILMKFTNMVSYWRKNNANVLTKTMTTISK